MRINVKGQVTIPSKIRERLGLVPHSEVAVEIDGDAVRIRKARTATRGEALIGLMRGAGTGTGMRTDDILKMTRGH